jgi:hypothetical protein
VPRGTGQPRSAMKGRGVNWQSTIVKGGQFNLLTEFH